MDKWALLRAGRFHHLHKSQFAAPRYLPTKKQQAFSGLLFRLAPAAMVEELGLLLSAA